MPDSVYGEEYAHPAGELEGKELLKEMSAEKIRILGDRISEILRWIDERTELNKKFLLEIDSELLELRKFPLYEHLDELRELNQEKRKEELGFWKDTVDLRRELKDFLRRYRMGLERVKIWRDRIEGK